MAKIEIFELPPEAHAYLKNILPERQRIFYVKYIVDKIGLFVPSKKKTVEWQITNPSGGLTLWDILRQGRYLILSTLSIPVGGLVRFDTRLARATIFTPNPNHLSLWSYSIQQDEKKRIWSSSTARNNPLRKNAPPQDNPTIARSELNKNSGTVDYWVLPSDLSYPHQLRYDKFSRLWFSLNLVNGSGKHQFAVFEPSSNKMTGFSIDGIGTAGISDIAIDEANETVWLTHRGPDEVYRFDWNTNEVDVYENHSVNGPDLNDLMAKPVPVFISRDGYVNTIDANHPTGKRKVFRKSYNVIPQRTELSSHPLNVAQTKSSVPVSTHVEPETYAGPFIRWPSPVITGTPTNQDIKTYGSYVYFIESGDTLLCRFKV